MLYGRRPRTDQTSHTCSVLCCTYISISAYIKNRTRNMRFLTLCTCAIATQMYVARGVQQQQQVYIQYKCYVAFWMHNLKYTRRCLSGKCIIRNNKSISRIYAMCVYDYCYDDDDDDADAPNTKCGTDTNA